MMSYWPKKQLSVPQPPPVWIVKKYTADQTHVTTNGPVRIYTHISVGGVVPQINGTWWVCTDTTGNVYFEYPVYVNNGLPHIHSFAGRLIGNGVWYTAIKKIYHLEQVISLEEYLTLTPAAIHARLMLCKPVKTLNNSVDVKLVNHGE